jgi:ornithine cyclodeaminase
MNSAMRPAAGFNDSDLVWLSEDQVADLVDLNDAMDALRIGFVEEAAGSAATIDKALGTWQGGAMHALGCMVPARHYAGFKTWAHTAHGATAIFSLFDMRDGRLLAVLEAATLGQIRTSAVSGLAAELLSDPDADELGLIGTGAQALTQAAAIATVRRLRRLRVFSPNAERRAAFVARARSRFECDVVDCGSVEQAAAAAPIVTLITRAREPFLAAEALAPGALLIAAGAILPAQAELFPDVLARAGRIVVDSLANARTGSRELIDHLGATADGWGAVETLGQVIRRISDVTPVAGLTVFKPMGSGISDISVAIMAYERAIERGIGLRIAQPRRTMPQWRPLPCSTALAS